MRIACLVLILAVIGLVFPASLEISVLEPAGTVGVYNGSSFNVSLNVTCGDEDCDDVDVSLMEADAPISCLQILGDNPGSENGIYTVCPNGVDCIEVYCDMDNGGWASIFEMEGDLTLDSRDCIMHNYNDDIDSTIMWTDFSAKVMNINSYATDGMNWFTWFRNGTEDMSAAYLPERPDGMGMNARPVPLPGANKTIWFDYENQNIVWDDYTVPFSAVGMESSGGCGSSSLYFITDGIDMIHVGIEGSVSARLLQFNFQDGSVSGEYATGFSPPNGWWSTEEDAFGNVLYTVNGRVMYFDSYPGSEGYFALGGGLDNPNSQYDTYNVTGWGNPSQPGLDFFARVDEDGYLWFGDWGHDNGGYFACGNDEYFGVGKTNIMLTYSSSGISDATLVSTAAGSHPFYTTGQNPQTVNLSAYESSIVNYSVVATTPGFYMFIGRANETESPFLGNLSGPLSVHTYNVAPPTPSQIAPFDGFYMHPAGLDINFSCGNGVIDTIALWADTGGSWQEIFSSPSYTDGETVSVNTGALDEGNYTWAVWCNTTLGDSAWSGNRTIHVTEDGLFECMDFYDPGTYVLLMNVSAPYNSNCFNVYSDDVTLDCAGFSITGDTCGYGQTGVYSPMVNTTVKNCTIRNFDEGVYFDYDSEYGDYSGNGTIIYNNISGGGYGVYLDYSHFNSVLYNIFDENDVGFYLNYADNNQIGRNNITSTSSANFGTGSCPFLYLYDGEGFEYYTDLAGESLGSPWFETPLYEAGIYELGGFQATDGAYRMKVREVIPESDFFDEMKLVVVDVPEGYGVLNQWHNTYSDDAAPPKDFMTIKDPKSPVSATDRYGNDVLAEVSEEDGVPLPTHDNEPNSVIVDFGNISRPEYAKLVITGWSSYESNPALSSLRNLKIETLDENGQWVVAKLFGKFSGDSRTFVFDISGVPKADDTRMRITAPYSKTTINVVDQILLDDSEPADIRVAYVDPSVANLKWGGATTYEYATAEHRHIVSDEQLPNVENFLMYGNFTRYGDVRPLVESADDMFAIMRHGDEIEFVFQDIPKTDGMDRYVFLQADVMYAIKYSVNGFVSDSIDPLPFHGMSKYPYGEGESYPYDGEHLEYLENWNTRAYSDSGNYGGSLPHSFNNTVYENNILGGMYSTGLYLEYEDETKLLYNNISGVEVGIDIYDSSDTNLTGNRVFSERGRGLILHQGSTGSTAVGNLFHSDSSEDCDYDGCGAVFLGRTDDNYFEGNNLTAIDGTGLAVGYSQFNEFMNNSISVTGGEYYAIRVWGEEAENTFLHNTIQSDYWVDDEGGGNAYSDEDSGNIYFTAGGLAAADIFDIIDTNGNGWADEGSDLPFSCDTAGECDSLHFFWANEGEDWHPFVSASRESDDDDTQIKPLSVEFTPGCRGNVVTVDGAGGDAHVVVKDSAGNVIAAGDTSGDEFTFSGCGLEGLAVKATQSGFLPGTLSGQDTVSCSECGVQNDTPGCTLDSGCLSNQKCVSGECVNVPCECGKVENRQCVPYACCSDSQCAADELCQSHVCTKKPQFECTSDGQCPASKYCDIPAGAAGGPCKDVTGPCGVVENHAFVPYGYECGSEPGCPQCDAGSSCSGHVCIPDNGLSCPTTGIVGDKKTCEAKENELPCANCDYVVTDPAGKNTTGRTDENGNFDLPLNTQGTYKVALMKDGAIVKVIEVKAFPQAQPEEPTKPAATGPDMGMVLMLLFVLLLVAAGIMYWRSRGKARMRK